jgi:hypothetical protein
MAVGDEKWLTAYFDDVARRGATAAPAVFRAVKFADESAPLPNHSHENVNRWVSEHPGSRPVRGWLVSAGFLYDAHSIVTDGGETFDITPLAYICPFIPHAGPEEEFILASHGRSQIPWPLSGLTLEMPSFEAGGLSEDECVGLDDVTDVTDIQPF